MGVPSGSQSVHGEGIGKVLPLLKKNVRDTWKIDSRSTRRLDTYRDAVHEPRKQSPISEAAL